MHDIGEATTHAEIKNAIDRAHMLRSQALTQSFRSLWTRLWRPAAAPAQPEVS